jgi:hypothetical protein
MFDCKQLSQLACPKRMLLETIPKTAERPALPDEKRANLHRFFTHFDASGVI